MARMTAQDVAEIFNRGRRAVHDLDVIEAHRDRLTSGLPSGGMPTVATGGGVSDPTARSANTLLALEQEWDEREAALQDDIDLCRELCSGVLNACGVETGVIMECRYLLAMDWKEISASVDRSVSYVKARKLEACEYVAEVGIERAKLGQMKETR